MIKFEIADSGFAEELKSFWRRSFLDAYVTLHTRENIESYFEASYTLAKAQAILSAEDIFCLKANRGGDTVGIATIHHRNCPLRKHESASELKQLYVLSSEYGTGLAHEMMTEVFRIIKEGGYKSVWLSVSKKNLRAQKFYKKLGFEFIGDGDDIHLGSEVLPSLIMLRSI